MATSPLLEASQLAARHASGQIAREPAGNQQASSQIAKPHTETPQASSELAPEPAANSQASSQTNQVSLAEVWKALASPSVRAEEYRKREQPGRIPLNLIGVHPANRGGQSVYLGKLRTLSMLLTHKQKDIGNYLKTTNINKFPLERLVNIYRAIGSDKKFRILVMDLIVLKVCNEIDLVQGSEFNERMKELFGDQIENDNDLASKAHISLQRAVREPMEKQGYTIFESRNRRRNRTGQRPPKRRAGCLASST